MRKVSIMLMVALATLCIAGSAFAAVLGTTHDISQAAGSPGTCSACHIPHKSPGAARLWPANMGTTASGAGVIGPLCAYCHHGSGGLAGVTIEASYAEQFVFPGETAGGLPHGLETNWATSSDGLNPAGGATLQDDIHTLSASAAFPYMDNADDEDVGANDIQCTTCHDVHTNTNRPFLRDTVENICLKCHMDRTADTNGSGGGSAAVFINWDFANQSGISNPGTHPVGPNVTNPTSARVKMITFSADWFQLLESGAARDFVPTDSSGIWNLGRHTSGSGTNGGVICISCHAVHGYDEDAAAQWISGTPQNNMLAQGNLLGVYQGQGSQPNGYAGQIYNGSGDNANFLCESCHHATAAQATWAADANQILTNDTANATYTGGFYPNPGATPYTHPIDDAPVMNDIVVDFSSTTHEWPAGGLNTIDAQGAQAASGAADADKPICESCHSPHIQRALAVSPGARGAGGTALTPPADLFDDAGPFLLRDDMTNICNGCHVAGGGTVANHHPTGTGYTGMGVNIVGDGIGRGAFGDGSPNGARTTQAGGDTSIGNGDATLSCNDCHNAGNASGGGAAHNWRGPLEGVMLDPDWDASSITCEKCHYLINGGITAGSPTNRGQAGSGDSTTDSGVAGNRIGESFFDETGTGTHYLGDTTLTDTVGGRYGALMTDNAAPGAGESHLICESCHDLRPSVNNGNNALLLVQFYEGIVESDNALCVGCHTKSPGGNVTHPLSGESVSTHDKIAGLDCLKFDDTTDIYASYPSKNAASGTPRSDGWVNCDSCHQTHNANTTSRTFILDAAELMVTAGDGTVSLRGGTPDTNHDGETHPSGYDHSTQQRPDYTLFCQQCHAY